MLLINTKLGWTVENKLLTSTPQLIIYGSLPFQLCSPKFFQSTLPSPCLSSYPAHTHTHRHINRTQAHTQRPHGLLTASPFPSCYTSGFDGWRAGWRVVVGRGEVEVPAVYSLFKVKWRVVLLQRVHLSQLRLCSWAEWGPLPRPLCYLSRSSRVLIVSMWLRRVLTVAVSQPPGWLSGRESHSVYGCVNERGRRSLYSL